MPEIDTEKKVGIPPSDESMGIPSGPPPLGPHPAGVAQYGGFHQFVRICSFSLWFFSCICVIFVTQLIGAPLYFINQQFYYSWMALTKQHFGVLATTITQWWSPTVIRVTGDRSVRDQIRMKPDGSLECKFPERLVLIANHQLYSDWLYLWWISYTARMHGFIYIILKESLKYLPIIGIGMQFYGFIFMARKWEQDKSRLEHRLTKLAKDRDDPMWLLIFPEGTNLSYNGRVTSAKYAAKLGIRDFQHQLIPRSTGLRFCLEQLDGAVEWVYDCTVAYEGIKRDEFGQDYFTLYSTYFQGRPPKSVNMHWRRFAVKDIPIKDTAEFEAWLRQRWAEKDDMLEYYMVNGRFPEDDEPSQNGVTGGSSGLRKRVTIGRQERVVKTTGGTNADGKWEGPVETEVKIARWTDVTSIFVVVGAALLLINCGSKLMSISSKFSGLV